MQLYIDGISVWAPGLVDWSQARAVLRGEQLYQPTSVPLPLPDVLHAAERRRAPATVKLAVHVAQAACNMADANPAALTSVFSSSLGDTEISDYMCTELAQSQPSLSPTRFHNSVHNAASGYWTIAVGCMHPANAISAGEHSFGTGLLEAVTLLNSDADRVLLVAYDITAPLAMQPLCPIPKSFAVALVLSSQSSARSVAQLRTAGSAGVDTEYMRGLPPFVSDLMNANPAARSLPLLHALANDIAAQLPLANVLWEVAVCH